MMPGYSCFNGATSFQTWKLHGGSIREGEEISLQWGHVFSDVETAVSQWTRRPDRRASMGPRLFRRGNSVSLPLSSNSAALQWGHVFSDVETVYFVGHGSCSTLLQWGHVFSDVETVPRPQADHGEGRFNGATSFQTWKRA